jgi:hypothetical protein
MKLKLEKIVEADGQKSHTWVYTFVPTLGAWKKKIVFRVKTKDPYKDLGSLGLPQTKNDTILLPWEKDGEQQKSTEGKVVEAD